MTEDQRLAIEHACARLVSLYANLNDAGAWPDVANLFTSDGRWARPTAPDQWIEGREAILGALMSRPARATRHLCSNIVITVLSADEAIGESAMALYLANDEAKVGSFVDRFQRTPDGWKFAERAGRLTF